VAINILFFLQGRTGDGLFLFSEEPEMDYFLSEFDNRHKKKLPRVVGSFLKTILSLKL